MEKEGGGGVTKSSMVHMESQGGYKIWTLCQLHIYTTSP